LPAKVVEREDEFRAEFEVQHGENMRNEFGRLIGKEIAKQTDKVVEFKRPEMVVLVNPFEKNVSLQPNPLFVSGRYRKTVRNIPQSKWFCSTCHGKGCKKCGWTGKMYKESVQEIIEGPFLKATEGLNASFHASGREDIDARMLGTGRPFVIEITRPRKRFLNLEQLQKEVNAAGKSKVRVSNLRPADKTVVRRLKKGESTQKEYRVLIEFENGITDRALRKVEKDLTKILIKQQTPLRVVHRRADITREKYIYEVDVKKLSLKKAEMKIRCQGGLYVKELVTGDEGRTIPNVSAILKNKAKPLKLDVLKVAMEDQELTEK
jgi:tRNA pseudouridine synthase 10